MEPNMNKRTDAKDPAEGLHSLDIDALVEARHPDPFSKLGLHQTESGHVVRVLLPGASGVTVIDRESGAALGSLTKIHDAGLYAGFVDRPGAYRLAIDWHGMPQDTHDTYAFSPVLSDEWLNRLAGGRSVCGARMPRLATGHARRRCRACASPCGRRMRGACRWSATSIHGTGAVIRCVCVITPACGNSSCRGSARARATSTRSSRATATRCR